MLRNYSMLKGIICKELGDRVKNSKAHYNLIVNDARLEYQVNIDVESLISPNVKLLFVESFHNKLLSYLDELGSSGLFQLDKHSNDYRLDYLRSNIFPVDSLERIQPKSWEQLSNVLDQHMCVGNKIYCLGEYYDDEQEREEVPHGLVLRETYSFLPSKGLHNIHMNQGTTLNLPQSKSNGIYQDGALFIRANDNTTKAFFFLFQGQSLQTDQSGNPVEP